MDENNETAGRLMQAMDQHAAAVYKHVTCQLNAIDAAASLCSVKNRVILAVSSAVDASGKKLYSNEESRKAEIDNRLTLTSEYGEDKAAQLELLNASADLDVARQYLSVVKLIARMSIPIEA